MGARLRTSNRRKTPVATCLLLLFLVAPPRSLAHDEWYRGLDLESALADSGLVLVGRVTDVSETKLGVGGKGERSLLQYKFEPVLVLKGVFSRESLLLSSDDLGTEQFIDAAPIEPGQLRLLVLGRSFAGYAMRREAPTLDQAIPPLRDPNEVGQIITRAKEPYATMFAVLGMTGCRAGEMLGLKIGDLDFNRKVIYIRRSIDSRTKAEQSTKTKNSTGEVPMPSALEKRLRAFLKHGHRENPDRYLFANRNGRTYSVGKVTEYGLWPVQDLLGIAHSGTHAFRHAAASELLEGGAPLTVVQQQLRHGDAKTTLQKYGHVVGDSQRRAIHGLAEKIESLAVELESGAELESNAA